MTGKFLITIFDEWVRNDLGKIDVQLFAETARIMAGGEASLCWMAKTCGRALIAEEDGAIYSCDHFVDDDHRLGMLQQKDLGEMANSDFQIAFGEAKRTTLTKECQSCPFLKFCNGGCLKDRFGKSNTGEEGQYYLCAGLKAFFAHALPVLEQVMKMSREGKTQAEIMASLHELR